MKYLTEEKILEHIPVACKFKLSALKLNTHAQKGDIRIKVVDDVVLYNWDDAVNTFKNPLNRTQEKTKIKYNVCTRLGIDPSTFEDDEEPLTEEELRDWGEKNLN